MASAQPGVSGAAPPTRLALFDLDHTLLLGDSDVLWCDFLMDMGVLERSAFAARNDDMEARYRAGTVGVQEFAGFYLATFAGRTPAQWEPLRQRFHIERIAPRIPPAALALVRSHVDAGELVVLTTATNRFITELTARHLGIAHLIATEAEQDGGGVFTGRIAGEPNMRAGKVSRLHAWLAARGQTLAGFERSSAYSDSNNDLPLLQAVTHPVAVHADERLAAHAAEHGWPVLRLD